MIIQNAGWLAGWLASSRHCVSRMYRMHVVRRDDSRVYYMAPRSSHAVFSDGAHIIDDVVNYG